LNKARARVIEDIRTKLNMAGTQKDFEAVFAKNLNSSGWSAETRRLINWLAVDSESAGKLLRELPESPDTELGR
jgi:hypothetical protein